MACHQELRTSGRAPGAMFMELGDEAGTLGANAIVGIDLDYENILEKKGAGREVRTNSGRTGNTQENA
ncbi:heavy metal-binding domain-containing protein [Gammaproteobacteria bacterium]|nr:heavy metal-binding domain-containing protein [Gammaproteobacteria bacterium]